MAKRGREVVLIGSALSEGAAHSKNFSRRWAMKYDYDSMETWEIHDLYDDVFGSCYEIFFQDSMEDWRDDIIECIESGEPQDRTKEKYRVTCPPGCVL